MQVHASIVHKLVDDCDAAPFMLTVLSLMLFGEVPKTQATTVVRAEVVMSKLAYMQLLDLCCQLLMQLSLELGLGRVKEHVSLWQAPKHLQTE